MAENLTFKTSPMTNQEIALELTKLTIANGTPGKSTYDELSKDIAILYAGYFQLARNNEAKQAMELLKALTD
ncbi:hypothetical protein D3C72_2373370 [compost metagenome]